MNRYARLFYQLAAASTVLALFPLPPPLAAVEKLSPLQTSAHIGDMATVCGAVANTYHSRFVPRQPTFINFGKPYPDHVFSVVIAGEDRASFGDCPEKLFAGREVCVTGLIEEYDGKPLMTIKEQSQVEWLGGS